MRGRARKACPGQGRALTQTYTHTHQHWTLAMALALAHTHRYLRNGVDSIVTDYVPAALEVFCKERLRPSGRGSQSQNSVSPTSHDDD